LAASLLAFFVLAVCAVAGTPLPLLVRWALSAALIVALWWEAAEHLGIPPRRRIVGLHWSADGRWLLRFRDEQVVEATLLTVYARVGLVILRFRMPGGWRRSLVLPWDSVDSEGARLLRVRLRISGLCR
jgi:hypothetical protein